MRPVPGELLHFSEDSQITRFVPHVANTAQQPEAYVWAVDATLAPAYWFPRQCPRAMAWAGPATTAADREQLLAADGGRVHAIEYGWLAAMTTTTLYAYRFAAADFRPIGHHAFVADHEGHPLGPPEPVGDLLALHDAAGIELRILSDLRPWWNRVIRSTVHFSGIRLRNGRNPM